MRAGVLLALLFLTINIFSQSIETSWFNPVSFTPIDQAKITKTDKNSIYYFINNKSSATFYHIDFKGNQLFSKSFSFPNINTHAIEIEDIVEYNNEFLLIVKVVTPDRISLMAQKINKTGELKKDFLMLSSVKKTEKGEIELDFAISPDMRNIAVSTSNTFSSGEKEKISIAIYDGDLTEIWKQTIIQIKPDRLGTSSQIVINDYREIYILQKSFYYGYYKYAVVSLSPNISGFKETSLHIDGISPTSVKIVLNADQNAVAAGYYTENQLTDKIETSGCFYVRFNGIDGISKAYNKFSETQFSLGKPNNMQLTNMFFDEYNVLILVGKCDMKSFSEVAGSMGSIEVPPYNKGLSINSFLESGNPGYSSLYGYFAPDEEEKLQLFNPASSLNDNKPFIFQNELGPTQYELVAKAISFNKFSNSFKSSFIEVEEPYVFHPSLIKQVSDNYYLITSVTPNQLRFGVMKIK